MADPRPPLNRALGFLAALALGLATTRAADWQPVAVPAPAPPPPGTSPVIYRCFLRVPDNMTSRAPVDLWTDSALFSLADLPGRFTLLLNGQPIAAGDGLPADPPRRFKIPKGILERKAFNVLALRLEGAAAHGLRAAPILHGYHDELVLEGTWERLAGEAAPADLRAVTNRPARAVFTEAQFREASTALAPNAELVRGQRRPPAETLASFRTQADLAVDLLLHEPRVAQPTHFSFDARGRLWVAQYRQYPYPAGLRMISRDKYYRATFDRLPPAPPRHDRGRDLISVHEDTDGDGVYDRHREVLTGLNMANAVLTGHGGIWVMHTPYLLFYPDRDGDDVPDGDPEVRLAGFGLEDTHSVANGLAWGPDGWIYGAQGSTTTSRITRPGSDPPGAPGVYFESCMVWRYHPDTRAYEIFAEGGGNNFGLEFDAEGRLFSGHNGGETRGWHFVQHGIYLKQGKDPGKFGPPTNPYAFGELGFLRTTNRIPRFSHYFAIAGGPALPAAYHGHYFNLDPLHRSIILSAPARAGSTFTTLDTGLALESSDPAFRPVYAAGAPDGSLYVADFYEEYIAHGQNYQGQIDPDSGRLYRLRGAQATLEKDIRLADKSSPDLVALLSHPNPWHRRTAVRLLGERRDPATRAALRRLLDSATAVHPALESLWALHQCGWLDEPTALAALAHPAAPVRAWAIRLSGDARQLSPPFLAAVQARLATEPDAEVRGQAASTARRLPARQALPLIDTLLRRDADAQDAFIPLLCWFALEQHGDTSRDDVLRLFGALTSSSLQGERPGVRGESVRGATPSPLWSSTLARQHILPRLMRRGAAKGTRADLLACAALFRSAPDAAARQLLLSAFEQAFQGRALPPLPVELADALADAGQPSLVFALRRGDTAAITQGLRVLQDTQAPLQERLQLVRTLGEIAVPGAGTALLAVARTEGDAGLRAAALAALSRYDAPAIGTAVATAYPQLPSALRSAAQNLLASRATWSRDLLGLIERGTLPAADLPADAVQRLRQHQDPVVAARAQRLLPGRADLRPDTRAAIARIESVLRAGPGNPYAGEPLFTARCAACHQLFHKGGRIGPNLTAYQRDDLGTLLPSLLDPNAEIREGYVNYLVETRDGRSLSGFLADQDAHVVVLRGFDGQDVPLRREEIQSMERAAASLMPAGLLDGLTDQQLRDFFAYLRIPQPMTR
ncbi:MAG: hypothetical protein RJA22_1968 [Verrucomicrobiota bacterium]